ncbi:MAG: PH domain-containing protein [Patescibacteria group bacterium]
MEKEYSFNGQRAREGVVAVIKNHPYVLFLPGLKAIVLWLLAAALIFSWSNEYSGLFAFILFVVGLSFLGRSYFVYSQSTLLITNQRVINIGQTGFWVRRITETELANIQDVSSHTSGVFRTMLKFGDLIIRTSGAAQGSEIIVKNIPNPYEVQQVIAGIK